MHPKDTEQNLLRLRAVIAALAAVGERPDSEKKASTIQHLEEMADEILDGLEGNLQG